MSFSVGSKGKTDISDSNIVSDFSNFNLNELNGVIGGRIHIYLAAETIKKYSAVELIVNSNGSLAIQEARGLNTINPLIGVSIVDCEKGEKCQIAISGITRIRCVSGARISKYNYLQLEPYAIKPDTGKVFDTGMNYINVAKPFVSPDATNNQNGNFYVGQLIYNLILNNVPRDQIVSAVDYYFGLINQQDSATNLKLEDVTILYIYDNLFVLMNTYPNRRNDFRWLFSQAGFTNYELAGRKGNMPDEFLAVALEDVALTGIDTTVLCYLTK